MNRVEVGFIVIASVATIGAIILIAVLSDKGVTGAQALFTLALVLVTSIYAMRTADIAKANSKMADEMKEQAKATKEQAEVSVRMAEEMREQRLSMYRPNILLEKGSGQRGQFFMKQMDIWISNEGRGPAINLELYISHPVFKYNEFRHIRTISVEQNPVSHSFEVKEPSVEEDPGINIDPVLLVVANYEDVIGNQWHSVLELHWDATNRDIKPGRMQVAALGYYNGVNQND